MSENSEFEPHPQCTAKSLPTELIHHVLMIEKVFCLLYETTFISWVNCLGQLWTSEKYPKIYSYDLLVEINFIIIKE